MSDLWDAAGDLWTNLQGKPGAKAGYIDGAESVWPPEAWEAFKADPTVKITVLASEAGEAFDGETGDAGPQAVAAAVANRVADGKWCWLYSNQDQLPSYLSAISRKGVRPLDRSLWPKAGVYLWLADPSGNIGAGRWVPPVDPVAVQDEFVGAYDHSTLYVDLAVATPPVPHPPAPPAPPQGGLVTVLVPQLSEGSHEPSVGAVQKLLGGLVVDDIFGPATKARVEQYQSVVGLAVDGIVGVHTWGGLCGHPQ